MITVNYYNQANQWRISATPSVKGSCPADSASSARHLPSAQGTAPAAATAIVVVVFLRSVSGTASASSDSAAGFPSTACARAPAGPSLWGRLPPNPSRSGSVSDASVFEAGSQRDPAASPSRSGAQAASPHFFLSNLNCWCSSQRPRPRTMPTDRGFPPWGSSCCAGQAAPCRNSVLPYQSCRSYSTSGY